MIEHPYEHCRPVFRWPDNENIRNRASRLSVRGEHVFHRLLVLLPTYLKSQPTSHASPFSPALLFSICDALQHDDLADGAAETPDTSALPSVLGKLREWRLLQQEWRYSPEGIHNLAVALAGITEEVSDSSRPNPSCMSHIRLRMRWLSSDPPRECRGQIPFAATTLSPLPPATALSSARCCAHTPSGERHSGAGHEPCQASRRGTPDSEETSVIISPRCPSVTGFRSGCLACRQPRAFGSSTPPGQRRLLVEQRMPFSHVNLPDTDIAASQKSGIQDAAKTTKCAKDASEPAVRAMHVDENNPFAPVRKVTAQGLFDVSFPRQRTITQSPRISNTVSLRDASTPGVASLQRERELPRLPNRTREGDKHIVRHCVVASADLRLPMSPVRPPNPARASPIDLRAHPHAPMTRTQTQSFSELLTSGNARVYGPGSVAEKVLKLPSNAARSRSPTRLPLRSQSHLYRDPTMTKFGSGRPAGSMIPLPTRVTTPNVRSCPSSGMPLQASGLLGPSIVMKRRNAHSWPLAP